MTQNIYNDIAERTHGDIYIGVVGAGCAPANPPLSNALWTLLYFPIWTMNTPKAAHKTSFRRVLPEKRS